MSYPLAPTRFDENPYKPEWYETDFLYSTDGRKNFPTHHCKQTYFASKPFINNFRNSLDIGCRDGEYSRYLQNDFVHTYSFDPNRRSNFAFNVDLRKTTHFTCALGDREETIQMSGAGHQLDKGLVRDVPAYRLDDFGFDDVDYIKIDVEGFERKVLVGGAETVKRNRPLIVIEQNDVRLAGEPPFAAKTWLEEIGYRHVATCSRGWDYIMAPE